MINSTSRKKCSKCLATKPVSEFYRKARSYASWCKACLKEYSRQRVADGRDRESKIKYEIKNGHVRTTRNALDLKLATMVSAIYRNIKKRDYFSRREATITKEQLRDMVYEFCERNYYVVTVKKHPFKPSVDRKDNAKGYSLDNVRIVWQIENYCKNTFSEDQVLEFCKRKLGLI